MSEQPDESAEAEEPSQEAIARRAYEISQGESPGSDEENWRRAERELGEEAETGTS